MSQERGDLIFVEVEAKLVYGEFLAATVALAHIPDRHPEGVLRRLSFEFIGSWKDDAKKLSVNFR